MVEQSRPAKAELIPVTLPSITPSRDPKTQATPLAGSDNVTVRAQFNPETLRLTQSAALDDKKQGGASAIQHVSRMTRKLTVDLWFDVTAPEPFGADASQPAPRDVREITERLDQFIVPKKASKKAKPTVKAVRFRWGTFLFDGVMQSANETIDFFSADGVPLRSKVSISISSQDSQLKMRDDTPAPGAGTTPTTPAHDADSTQALANRNGLGDQWAAVAHVNKIENARRLAAGQRLALPTETTEVLPWA